MVTNSYPCPDLPGSSVPSVGLNYHTSAPHHPSSGQLIGPVGMPFLPGLTPSESTYYSGHPYVNSMYGNYEFPGYPMLRNGYGLDLKGSRRLSTTGESTSSLKAWLNDHKKYPYPTKAEKIMLAIMNQMSLTQVSTWFANARRRLKKDNKMTWSLKNRGDDYEDCGGEGSLKEQQFTSSLGSNGDKDLDESDSDIDIETDDSTSDTLIVNKRVEEAPVKDQPNSKPKIWSIVELATSKDPNHH